MVKFNKSNWAVVGLFLLAIVIAVQFQNKTSASTFNDQLPKVAAEEIEFAEQIPTVLAQQTVTTTADIEPVQSEVIEKPNTQFIAAGYGLKIDAINLNIPLYTTTLGKNKELLVPANPNQAAWYKNGPNPGAAGTTLITGHLDSLAGPGVFWNLRNLKPDQTIEVKRDDGKIAVYKIEKLESYAQDHTFPWNEVYRTSGTSALRIITCDGVYNPKTQRYSRNLVVYASLVSIS